MPVMATRMARAVPVETAETVKVMATTAPVITVVPMVVNPPAVIIQKATILVVTTGEQMMVITPAVTMAGVAETVVVMVEATADNN